MNWVRESQSLNPGSSGCWSNRGSESTTVAWLWILPGDSSPGVHDLPLWKRCSKFSSQTSGISITQEQVRVQILHFILDLLNKNLSEWVSSFCGLTSPPGDSDPLSSLRSSVTQFLFQGLGPVWKTLEVDSQLYGSPAAGHALDLGLWRGYQDT